MKEERPFLAAILAGIFGPVGFLYFGWRHAISVSMLAALMFLLLMLAAPIDSTLIIWGVGSENFIGAVIAGFLAKYRRRRIPVPDSGMESIIVNALMFFLALCTLVYAILAILHNFAMLNWKAFGITIIVAISLLQAVTFRVTSWIALIYTLTRIPNILARWCLRDFRSDEFGEEIISILEVLDEAGLKFNSHAFEMLREKITAALRIVPEDFSKKIQGGISPRRTVYSMLANTAGDLLESGRYHMVRNILNSSGEDLLRIFEGSVDEMCIMGAIDSKEANSQKNILRNRIKEIR